MFRLQIVLERQKTASIDVVLKKNKRETSEKIFEQMKIFLQERQDENLKPRKKKENLRRTKQKRVHIYKKKRKKKYREK